MTTRVLVADDHVGFRRALVGVIHEQADLEVVAEAGRGDTALALIRRLGPDLAIVDHSMPGLTGVEIAEAVRAEQLATRVIVVTIYADDALASRALEAGAAAFVAKSALDDDLRAAMTAALGGDRFASATSRRARV